MKTFAFIFGLCVSLACEAGVTTNLFLLVGQSNMAGRGRLRGETPVSSDRIVVFDENGQARPATEPLHHDLASAGAGLAMSFARAYADEHPGEVVGLLPCAMGGSAIATWKPGVGKNYRAAIEMARAVREKGRFAGILWHQGENNATTEARLKGYAENLREVIAGFRKDVADVPFVAGELGSFLEKRTTKPKDGGQPVAAIPYWREINRLTREVCASTPRCACVKTADLTPNGDNIHFNTASLRTLGLRYYEAWKSVSAKADSFQP